MFQQAKNIDTAFKHIKAFSIVLIAACTLISLYALYQGHATMHKSQQKIFILSGGKVLEAYAADRKDNIAVEARDHIRMFHYYFFTLDPDDKVIQANITKALYLSDASAKQQYDDLKENSYYANIISGNISQQLEVDSIAVSTEQYPFHFTCKGIEKIIRPTSIVTRRLITDGYLRNVTRSDNNPHGFLIEKWKILDNADIKTQAR